MTFYGKKKTRLLRTEAWSFENRAKILLDRPDVDLRLKNGAHFLVYFVFYIFGHEKLVSSTQFCSILVSKVCNKAYEDHFTSVISVLLFPYGSSLIRLVRVY